MGSLGLGLDVTLGSGGLAARGSIVMPSGGLSRWMASKNVYKSAGVPVTEGSVVYQVNDQVGVTNAGQVTPANQPIWKTGQFPNALAGYDPGIVFNGSSDFLSYTPQNLGTANTLIVTLKITSYGAIVGGAAGNYCLYTANNLVAYSTNTGVQQFVQVLNPLALNTPYTVAVRRNGANVDFTVNSLTPGNWGSGANASMTGALTVDELSSLDGLSLISGHILAEDALYTRYLSDADVITAMTAHRNLYGAF